MDLYEHKIQWSLFYHVATQIYSENVKKKKKQTHFQAVLHPTATSYFMKLYFVKSNVFQKYNY